MPPSTIRACLAAGKLEYLASFGLAAKTRTRLYPRAGRPRRDRDPPYLWHPYTPRTPGSSRAGHPQGEASPYCPEAGVSGACRYHPGGGSDGLEGNHPWKCHTYRSPSSGA